MTSTFGYDAAGNMTSSSTPANGSQTMTWAANGKLGSVSSSKGTTSYVYDADGDLLLKENPGVTISYLPNEQLTATTSGSTTTVTGARIIPLPSGGDVVRTGATTSYYFEIPDQQGTNELYLDNTAQIPTWRQFTPYGSSRGTAVTWIDNRGFLNKPADPDTGLDYVGARAYDPAVSQFISPDPVLATSNPQDLNPYDYAEDNPETDEDPSGDMLCEAGGPCGSVQYLEHRGDQQSTSSSGGSGGGGFLSDLESVLDPGCAGTGCSWMSGGDLLAPVAASTIPIYRNRTMLSGLTKVKAAAKPFNDAEYGSFLLDNRAGALNKFIDESTENLVSGGRVLRWGGVGLTVAGGASAAYGEFSQSHGNVAKTVTVGVGDTAIGFLAGAAGSVAAGALMGTEYGAAIGTLIPIPGAGTAVGAVAGAVIGGAIGLASSNLFNDAVNSRIWNGITSLI